MRRTATVLATSLALLAPAPAFAAECSRGSITVDQPTPRTVAPGDPVTIRATFTGNLKTARITLWNKAANEPVPTDTPSRAVQDVPTGETRNVSFLLRPTKTVSLTAYYVFDAAPCGPQVQGATDLGTITVDPNATPAPPSPPEYDATPAAPPLPTLHPRRRAPFVFIFEGKGVPGNEVMLYRTGRDGAGAPLPPVLVAEGRTNAWGKFYIRKRFEADRKTATFVVTVGNRASRSRDLLLF